MLSRLCDIRQMYNLSDPQFLLHEVGRLVCFTGSLGGRKATAHMEGPTVPGTEETADTCSFPKFPPQTGSCSRALDVRRFPPPPCALHWCFVAGRTRRVPHTAPSWCRLPGRRAALRGVIRQGNARAVWKSGMGQTRGCHILCHPPTVAQPCIQGGSPPASTHQAEQAAWQALDPGSWCPDSGEWHRMNHR